MEDKKLFDIELFELYDYPVDKSYELVKANTSYLDDSSVDEVKQIMYSYYKDIIILFNNGEVFINGDKKFENIRILHFLNATEILAITNNKVILSVFNEDLLDVYFNNNNCEYKKIILCPVSLTALTYDKVIKTVTPFQVAVDYKRFYGVDDIGYIEENEDIVVIKDDKVYSLFDYYDYSNDKPNIMLDGKSKDIFII